MLRAARAGTAVSLSVLAAALAAQVTLEQITGQLKSADANVRLDAVRQLRTSASADAAVPLIPLLNDPDDRVQLEAIGAELAIFLDEPVPTRRRVGLVFEVRSDIASEVAFAAGPLALGARPVPEELLTALRIAARDATPRIALEAMYAFGTLGSQAAGAARVEHQRVSAPDLEAHLGSPNAVLRLATLRVIGRLFAHRPWDRTIDQNLGDAVIGALNDRNVTIRLAAMDTLGAMRYVRAVEALTELHRYFKQGTPAEASLDALARIAVPPSVPLFEAALNADSPEMRRRGVEGLARNGDRAKAETVRQALRGERRQPLALAGSLADVLLADGAIDGVVVALGRDDLRDQAIGYLIELAPGRSKQLARFAQDPGPPVRAAIADALGFSGDAGAIPVVDGLLRDADPGVVGAATRAAARLRADTQ
jgi:HEAT repeat protein